jgi:hypothetical protein
MKVKDLIDELNRFNPDDKVCVELTDKNTRDLYDSGDDAANFEVDTVLPENDGRHSVKLTIL